MSQNKSVKTIFYLVHNTSVKQYKMSDWSRKSSKTVSAQKPYLGQKNKHFQIFDPASICKVSKQVKKKQHIFQLAHHVSAKATEI